MIDLGQIADTIDADVAIERKPDWAIGGGRWRIELSRRSDDDERLRDVPRKINGQGETLEEAITAVASAAAAVLKNALERRVERADDLGRILNQIEVARS